MDTLANGKLVHVEPLIRSIIVTVDLEHVHDIMGWLGSEPKDKEERPAVRDLRRLLKFENVEWIGIEIRGGGALDGSDLRTQQKIKEIAKAVKELIDRF